MIIPWQSLSDDVLDALLQEVVTRDGTDYGAMEKTTEQKVTFARNQLKSGYAALLWNTESESASLVSSEVARDIEQQTLDAESSATDSTE
ncbi:MAG: YheU family protein [Acidiferrobacterales bacterium]|nr:YheU family protein [Acidiferrobacterales bacterium]